MEATLKATMTATFGGFTTKNKGFELWRFKKKEGKNENKVNKNRKNENETKN